MGVETAAPVSASTTVMRTPSFPGVSYEAMLAGKYKLLVEPLAYFTHNGLFYCMTATEAALNLLTLPKCKALLLWTVLE